MLDTVGPSVNTRGTQFYQLFQLVPQLKSFYTEFEANYDTAYGVDFTKVHWEIPITAVVIYMIAIYQGKKFMDKIEYSKIWNLKKQLALWNAFLCFLSFAGACRTVPHLLYNLMNQSYEETICTTAESWGSGSTGLWVQIFVFSKFPELWDTFYIVARKRPLIFLHWYHHVTVLLYCWHAYSTEASQALYFVAMNYSVHAVMYGYYCLMALKIKPPIPPVFITSIQITQMIVGTVVQLSSMYYYNKSGSSCGVNFNNLVAGALMYGSYFYLFADFAVRRFILKPKAAKKAA